MQRKFELAFENLCRRDSRAGGRVAGDLPCMAMEEREHEMADHVCEKYSRRQRCQHRTDQNNGNQNTPLEVEPTALFSAIEVLGYDLIVSEIGSYTIPFACDCCGFRYNFCLRAG